MLNYICSGNGNIIVNFDGENICIDSDHVNHKMVTEALAAGDEEQLRALIDIPTAIKKYGAGDIEVDGDTVRYRGKPVYGYLVDRILEQMRLGYGYQPMCSFLENMHDNPSPESVEQLYPFLENNGLVLTDDGCFLAYKYVYNNGDEGKYRPSWKNPDGSYNDTSPGTVVRMSRSDVCYDPEQACAAGLHVGTPDYVGNGGDAIMLVKVNPKHAVSVPDEHAHGKLRCCEYYNVKVVELIKNEDNDYAYQYGLTNVGSDGYSDSKYAELYQTASHW